MQQEPFKPAWWMPNRHAQTILPAFRLIPGVVHRRETLPTPDGDFLDLDWSPGEVDAIVILLHGLTGSSNSTYVRGMQYALYQRGFRCVAMNFRGCSGRPNDRARAYHSGDTSDLDYLYSQLRLREADTPIGVVGFSLGGNVLLKWLGEKQDAVDLFACAAVSPPFELKKCAQAMGDGWARMYRYQLIRDMIDYMHMKRDHLVAINATREARKLEDLGDLSGIRSFEEYDQRVIAPLYNFRDVWDYYERSSCRPYLRDIHNPTLVVHSIDDPFFCPEIVPSTEELSGSVQLETLPAGGHVGFVAGDSPGRPVYWLEHRIPDYLQQRLQHCNRSESVSCHPLHPTPRHDRVSKPVQ